MQNKIILRAYINDSRVSHLIFLLMSYIYRPVQCRRIVVQHLLRLIFP
jgi:hypothetical protein